MKVLPGTAVGLNEIIFINGLVSCPAYSKFSITLIMMTMMMTILLMHS